MARTTSVTIGEPLEKFVNRMLESGRYGSASEVMRSALRLLEQQENQLEHLRNAIDEGELSGESTLSVKEIVAKKKASMHV
ncbi:type II toxin-antitoxin system ParD family antitoxin [Vibrio sp. JC009]|uniref:type II toxin-antitoxin system ParD family antitoxin n=1 Tax=Vibrio sp. JC009 TaxID=2912314 RepID=UPI0023AFDD83|nr:type II toxin-antitoxin system ParD family antitoxin [Vibrio sp. JC009]WED22046.1 type II toxin-antitoxin system ParD family antitoxin [Vibrio sp. JC009]